MNQIETALKDTIAKEVLALYNLTLSHEQIIVEIPREKNHGDYSTNIAMRLAKQIGKNPRDIAAALAERFLAHTDIIRSVEVAGPGFLNFTLVKTALADVITLVLSQGDDYGNSSAGQGKKVNLEYVSANPTGDLHPGHARGAAAGDSVARLQKRAGYEVCREYYLNDAGNQINNMAASLYARYQQQFGLEALLPEDGYYGADLIAIAASLKQEVGESLLDIDKEEALKVCKAYGLKAEKEKLEEDLKLFRVEFDVWSSEQSLYDQGLVEEALKALRQRDKTYESEGALWLKTTEYGDDKDRVLRKSDGSYTYLVPDIAYHVQKFERGFTQLVNFWGADHHGYIKRLKASLAALGHNPDILEVDIIQMVRMIKDQAEFKLSKRSGKALSLKDLIEEAGVDALRYFFASRQCDTHMDLDLDLATKESSENPVYYAQYAHARMCSILKAADQLAKPQDYERLTHDKEILLLKQLALFPNLVADCARERTPHRICTYIQKLAADFHSFYGECKVLDPNDPELSSQRSDLVRAVRITLKNALDCIGVSAPEMM
ncbi:MAG: arginine--tRNA ligase [Erysipelotrichaceae bacterium]|jgi:arginyl-tRNA synthetase|nr:arginine--tRNA ligase [Erysipelotrichaceae bacterium]